MFTMLIIPLIIFGNLSPTDAIKNGISLVFKKFWVVFALFFVTIVISIFCIFGLCIGIFFTTPLWFSTIFAIYNSMIGVENTSEIDQIGNNEY